METVCITRTDNRLDSAVDTMLETVDPKIDPDLPVLMKPNICCLKGPETGATTDPRIVEAVAKHFRRHYAVKEIYIIESDATSLDADLAFQLLGYNRLGSRAGIKIVNLTKIPYRPVEFARNLSLCQIKVPTIFQKPHFLVSIAKMKTHNSCGLTATLKNMYGCNPEPYKARYHRRLSENIVDFAAAFTPHLSVIDATLAMEGCGPVDGVPVKLDTLIAGTDPVATDSVVAKMMGINPRKVRHLRLAEKQGLGTTRFRIEGTEQVEIRRLRRRPRTLEFVSRLRSLF